MPVFAGATSRPVGQIGEVIEKVARGSGKDSGGDLNGKGFAIEGLGFVDDNRIDHDQAGAVHIGLRKPVLV